MSEVVVPLHGGVRVDDQVPEQLHPDDGVHEEEHSHQHAHVRQRLQLQTIVNRYNQIVMIIVILKAIENGEKISTQIST